MFLQARHLVGATVANKVPERYAAWEYLDRGHPPSCIGGGHEPLSDQEPQTTRQGLSRFRLVHGGEHINQAIDGLRRGFAAYRAEYEMAGFRGSKGESDRFPVVQLADDNHIRVLAQRAPQRGGDASRVGSDLALT